MQPDDSKIRLVCHLLLVNLWLCIQHLSGDSGLGLSFGSRQPHSSLLSLVMHRQVRIGGLISHALCFMHFTQEGASNCTCRVISHQFGRICQSYHRDQNHYKQTLYKTCFASLAQFVLNKNQEINLQNRFLSMSSCKKENASVSNARKAELPLCIITKS